jgi:hypothetical protein
MCPHFAHMEEQCTIYQNNVNVKNTPSCQFCWVLWYVPVIPALGRLQWKDLKVESSLEYIAASLGKLSVLVNNLNVP